MPTLPRLRTYRQRAMLSQRALAEKSKVSLVTICRIESGKEVRYVTAHRLASALNVTPQELAGIEE